MHFNERAWAAEEIAKRRVVAVVRLRQPVPSWLWRALYDSGISCIEITLDTPGALEAVEEIAAELPGALVGVGTCLRVEDVFRAAKAGAVFAASPIGDEEFVKACARAGIAAIPAAMTPTEAARAWRAGADMVKVFPADVVGPPFFRRLKGPLPGIRTIATGGVSADNAGEFLAAGADAVGVGGWLVNDDSVAAQDVSGIQSRARRLLEAVRACSA